MIQIKTTNQEIIEYIDFEHEELADPRFELSENGIVVETFEEFERIAYKNDITLCITPLDALNASYQYEKFMDSID